MLYSDHDRPNHDQDIHQPVRGDGAGTFDRRGLRPAQRGCFITRFKITPFIITLGSQQIFTGLVYVLTEGRTVMGIPGSFTAIGQGMIFSIIPVPFLIMIVMGIIMFFVLKYTPFGRYRMPIGGNQSAATLVGISVNRCRTVVYVISGVLAALAGMLMMARLGSAQPTLA